MIQYIEKWNIANPDNKVEEAEFITFFKFKKMVHRVGVENFVANFPFADHRQLVDNNITTDKYLYDGIAWIIIHSVENSNGKFKPQKFLEIKKM